MSPRVLWPEFGIGLGLVLLRLVLVPPGLLWRDWLLLLGLFGIFWSLGRRSPAAPLVTATACAYLLAIHVFGHLPHALTVWGLRF